MSASGGRLPYPGLRSFTREETDLFFGREGSVDHMVDRLAATRFLAVLGASGSGKSSLVKTGLLDALELGLLHKAGSRWMIADFRPGDRPIHNLAEGLLRAASTSPAAQPDEDETRLLRAFLARGPRSVIEWCQADNLPPGANLLLLVDQFEELFRYSAYAEREEAEAFVALLLESARAPLSEARIYVCITMRSEYLGAAALIDGLAEAINAGLYLTPRMSRDEVREAIVGPAAVCGFSIEPALVNRLLNDLSSFAPWEDADTGHQLERLVRRADQLPLMQHVLNRLWSIAEQRGAGGPIELTLADYEALGGLRGALAAHGREILDELLPEHREAASAVFGALTSGSSLAEAVRRPTEFGDLVAIAGGDEIAVREIVEAFRAPGRNFLVPARPTPLRAKTVIDISHESLIRQWDEFAGWLQREITSAETWRRLVDAAERYKRGEANLLSGLTLASISNWWDTERPAAAWAKRYGGDFSQAAEFLADSRRAEEEAKQAEAEERRKKSRSRLVTAAVVAFLCIVTPLAAFAGYMAWSANREALRASQQADAADAARSQAEVERQAAEAERQRADQERTRALASQREAVEQARAAEVERQRADEERQRALAAQQEALQQAAAAEAERKRADEERRRALAAQQEAVQQATAAEAERKRADDERTRALAAQQEAIQQAAAAETERKRADEERQRALAAQQEAVQQAAAAEAERKRADEERQRALAAQEDAIEQAAAAEEQRERADEERERALTAQQEAVQAAALAQAESARADQERQRAEHARAEFQRSNLQQLAGRVTASQTEGAWDVAANLLGTFWQRLAGPEPGPRENWLIEPIVAAFSRQSMAEYPVFPDFLAYSGFSGWTGTSGRFRVYALTRKGPDGKPIADSNKVMAVFDAATGAVLGSFELPKGSDLGNEIDLVSPDGSRVAIITDKGEIAVWANGQGSPTLVPVPQRSGKTVVSQLAPVSTDARFALYLTLGDTPDEIIVIDPAKNSATFRVSAADIATGVGVEAVKTVKLLGLVDGKILALVNDSGGSVASIDTSTGAVRAVETGAGVTGAQITMDGGILLTLTCPGSCSEQHLTAYDLRRETPLWVERVPLGMTLSEPAVPEITVAGVPTYSALVEQEGTGIIFEMPKARPDVVTRREGKTHPRIGLITLDGQGGYRTAEPAKDVSSSDGVPAAAVLANYRLPITRKKLGLYVAPNSVAVYQGEDGVRIGGVTYSGDLLVYRLGPNGELEGDVAFRPMPIAGSDCVAAVAFGGDGRSLLFRHVDGSLLYAAAVGEGTSIGWHSPLSAREESITLAEASPATECAKQEDPAEGAVVDKIVPVDAAGEKFAMLDKDGAVWWVDAAGSASGEPLLATRNFAPLQRAASGMVGIAGDPARGRVAFLSRSAVEIVPTQGVAAADARVEAAATGQDPSGRHRIVRWGEPRAAAFRSNGDVDVAYNGGQVTNFRQEEDGVWSPSMDGLSFLKGVTAVFSSGQHIAVANSRDAVVALDPASGAVIGYSRVPANPSMLALAADGNILSLEWDTDSASVVPFGGLPSTRDVADAARLLAMRSALGEEADASLDSLILDHEMEVSLSASTKSSTPDCAAEARIQVSRLESRLLGDAATGPLAPLPAECGSSSANGSSEAAEALARRGAGASVRELVEDGAFSRVLQAASAGDQTASRVLGAALARIAVGRGELDRSAIALEAMRLGTDLPGFVLPGIAAGDPIDPKLLELARARKGVDPAAHQLIAHAEERKINDIDALANALTEYSIAERLYRAAGQRKEAEFTTHRRAQLARLLPDERVLQIAATLDSWKPEMPDIAPSSPLADLPTDAVERRALDAKNADALAERLPGSPLLEALRAELDHAS